MYKKLFSILILGVLLSGCGANSLNRGGAHVIVSNDKPPQGCKFIQQIHGDQGNWFTGPWTSNKNIQVGAMNSVRNNAGKLHANYVELINANTSANISDGDGREVGMQFLGNAYWCPPSLIGM